MRAAVLFCLIALGAVGCGKTEEARDGGQGLGSIISPISTPADAATQSRAQVLCQLLADKDTNFRSRYLNEYNTFNFSTSLRNCQGATQTSSVKARLRSNAGKLEYQILAGNYLSTAVETAQAGQLSVLCRGNLTRTIQLSESAVAEYFFAAGASCGAGANDVCVTLRTAFKQNSGLYQIQMIDEFVVDTSATALRGMIRRHSRYDLANCVDGASVLNTSTFSGITTE